MTKVIILGQEPEKKKGKPIKFVSYLSEHGRIEKDALPPSEWDNIEVVSIQYGDDFDLFFCYSQERSNGVLYLGHYNDGIVE